MSNPRTALVAHPSADLYGSDRVLLETLSALLEAGYRTVLTLPEHGRLAEEAAARGVEFRVCPSPIVRKPAMRPLGALRLLATAVRSIGPALRLLRSVKPDLVVVNTVTIPLWLGLGRILRTSTFCHVHEAEASQPALVRRLLYAPLLLADKIIANSEFTLGVVAASWPRLRRRSTVIHNSVPGPSTDPSGPGSTPQDPARMLFVGRLSPRKGPQVALAAVAELRRRGVRVRLGLLGSVFPGYEWFESTLHERVRSLDLEADVDFLGFDADIWAHLAAADIICVPSIADESFGNTAVEAMLAQRPLVVSATTGLKEAAAGFSCAWFVTPGDPNAIADAVQGIVACWPELSARVAEDRRLAIERYDPFVYRRAVVSALGGEGQR